VLAPGTRLGPYEIVTHIAAGGMGDVYRARDHRLARDIALKVLPPHMADPESRRRFEQEARAASALSHPHIVTIHDVGETDGVAYLAMELVEGRTLRAVAADGALPLKPLLRVAVQIAGALTAAHAKGIVHRDLKPENVIVTADGDAKVLDFGLAKAAQAPGLEQMTGTVFATQAGVVLGTAGYMSPEQARGETTDFRTDQFSLGTILYELATGRRAFARGSMVETASAVITDEPEAIDRLCPAIPPPLQWAIERCMAKRPQDRYGSTADLQRDLVAVHDRLSDRRGPAHTQSAPALPGLGTPLIGRDRAVADLGRLLRRDEVRWVTMTGPGGVGKTRLAVQAASEISGEFPGMACFVPLAALTDFTLVPSAIAEAMDLRAEGGETPLDALKRHLRRSRSPSLLVIDNFEHVADAAPKVTELLECSPTLKVLVTSRSVLHVYAEREYPVPPLATPDRKMSLEAVAATPAVALFVQRAAAARPDFQLTADNVSAVVDICSRLDGLPMAIELAAARIKLLPPAALLARLEGRLLSLAGGARDLPARQQTLRNALDWSYGLLSPEEQRLFRRLAVFAGGWTIESAEAVCDAAQDLGIDTLDGIASLVDKSLAKRLDAPAADSAEPRFIMLETMREYGFERLDEAGETRGTRRAHAAYNLIVAEEDMTSSAIAQAQWLALCDAEHANFRSALQFLIDTRDGEWGLRLATALFQFWHVRGHLIEARERLTALLRMPEAASFGSLRARAGFELGSIMHVLGDWAGAIAFSTGALAEYRALDNPHGTAMTLNGLGIIQRDFGDFVRARECFDESVTVWQRIGDQHAAARTLSNLATVSVAEGDYDKARRIYAECRAMFRQLGDDEGVAWTLSHEGDGARSHGALGDARTLLEDALRRFERLQDDRGVGNALLSLGHVALAEGDAHAARACYLRALGAYRRINDPRTLARLLEAFACAAAFAQDAERALALAGAAAALRDAMGSKLQSADRAMLEAALEPLRTGPDAPAVTNAWMTGWGMGAEEAIAYAAAGDAT
jgi:predicted ATPase